ncbi:hypothetical protein BMIN_0699 [Bifidobacterium minimum]|uniref:Uncharacterized protein n=1 Tax=Bifidobacterium minimum TaxID=1693 RepID=A0A087BPN7_9BIFI|nr:hypothetical protein BMIN_0699 [Bifidobacterium minimum]
MRGKRRRATRLLSCGRIIPASAGQTFTAMASMLHISDHPRECGANSTEHSASIGSRGSSPRVRGKRPSSTDASQATRIIPASAGQTDRARAHRAHDADHPRECGANLGIGYESQYNRGSSPRVRGKRWKVVSEDSANRIIPASAGQTHMVGLMYGRSTDHPRECGANCFLPSRTELHKGSSPRVRGKPDAVGSSDGRTGIIPASAGQTGILGNGTAHLTDHPRECGANGIKTDVSKAMKGSSPRVRGKPAVLAVGVDQLGIIPASAGQTHWAQGIWPVR